MVIVFQAGRCRPPRRVARAVGGAAYKDEPKVNIFFQRSALFLRLSAGGPALSAVGVPAVVVMKVIIAAAAIIAAPAAAPAFLTLFVFGRKISYLCLSRGAGRRGLPLFVGVRGRISGENAGNGSGKCTTCISKWVTCILKSVTSPRKCK